MSDTTPQVPSIETARREGLPVALVAAFAALVVYVPRVAPTLSLQGDSAVFVSAAATWGIPQPSGYPLYTLLGHLASKVPLGEIPYRLHLLSALLHAATVFVVALAIVALTRSRAAALGGALALAFSRAFFHGSLYAEVFPLLDLFTAVALLVGVDLWGRLLVARASPGPEADRRVERGLFAMALVAGLASSHHQMIALVAPALAFLWLHPLLAPDPAEPWAPRLREGLGRLARASVSRRAGRLFLVFAAPIVVFYALIPLAASREPLSSWGDVRSLDALVALVTRRDYGGLLSPHLGGPPVARAVLAGAWLDGVALSFGWILLVVSGIGLASLVRRGDAERPILRPVGLALVIAVVTSGPFFAVKNALEVESEHGRAFAERFATMSAVPLAILIGVGLAAIARVAAAHLPERVVAVFVGLVFLIPLVRHAEACDLRGSRRGIAVAHDLLRDVPDGSLVLISGDALNGAALYACGVERRCGRTLVFSPGQLHLPWRVEQLRRRHPDLVIPAPTGKFVTTRELVAANIVTRPVYVVAPLLDREPALREAFQFVPDGILVRVLPDDDALAADVGPFLERARRFAFGAGCEGCGISRSELHAPSLETSIPFLYALAFENHARVLSVWSPDRGLAAFFARRAEQTDPEAIRAMRGQ